MAPSYEAKLLTDFLVAPASLRDFMTPHQFASVFPSAHRSNPAIQELYRELHALRERDIDAVRKDIADEVRRSKQLKREYAHQRRQMDTATVTGLDPVALQMEQELSGAYNKNEKNPHSLQTVTASINEACASLEAQIADVEEATRGALDEVQEAVGALSDLRHGRFAQSASGEDLVEQVLENLKKLEAVCADPTG